MKGFSGGRGAKNEDDKIIRTRDEEDDIKYYEVVAEVDIRKLFGPCGISKKR